MAKRHAKKARASAASTGPEALTPPVGSRLHSRWPKYADLVVVGGVLIYIALIALFAIRNNDIWWHLAVGKTLLETKSFITTDPFSFATMGTPWVPQSWLAGLVFYLVHASSSAAGLVALRASIVLATFVLSLRVLKRLGVSLTLVAPLVLLVALNAHSRFILRPHLFEYLFIVLLVGHLLFVKSDAGRRFWVLPVLLQALWVNTHASFFLGPIIVLLFFTGEAASRRWSGSLGTTTIIRDAPAVDWRKVAMLLGLMMVASLLNPSPIAFITQPLSGEQRELLTRYTLEWRSPFDPTMAAAAFHPYYEILLGVVGLVFVISIRRLQLASLLLVGLFAVLSLQAHRFRVEFALTALILVSAQLGVAPAIVAGARRLQRAKPFVAITPHVVAVLIAVALVYTARDRVELQGTVSDRFPEGAMDFVRDNDVGERTFQSIGFGSYQIWKLYPDRQTFVDGRNIDAAVYQDFLSCQTNSAGFNDVVRKHHLDAFVIPAPERSDGGMSNLHGFLSGGDNWSLVYLDRHAYVYVRNTTVAEDWLTANAYRVYQPSRFAEGPPAENEWPRLAAELERAVAGDPNYLTPVLDLASFAQFTGDTARAISALNTAVEHGGDPGQLLPALYQQYASRADWAQARRVARALGQARPSDPRALFYEGWAQLGLGEVEDAIRLAREGRARFPENLDMRILMARIHISRQNYAAAKPEIDAVLTRDPRNQQALALRAMLERAPR